MVVVVSLWSETRGGARAGAEAGSRDGAGVGDGAGEVLGAGGLELVGRE